MRPLLKDLFRTKDESERWIWLHLIWIMQVWSVCNVSANTTSCVCCKDSVASEENAPNLINQLGLHGFIFYLYLRVSIVFQFESRNYQLHVQVITTPGIYWLTTFDRLATHKKKIQEQGRNQRAASVHSMSRRRRAEAGAQEINPSNEIMECMQSKSKHKQGIFECKRRVLSESFTKSDCEIISHALKPRNLKYSLEWCGVTEKWAHWASVAHSSSLKAQNWYDTTERPPGVTFTQKRKDMSCINFDTSIVSPATNRDRRPLSINRMKLGLFWD